MVAAGAFTGFSGLVIFAPSDQVLLLCSRCGILFRAPLTVGLIIHRKFPDLAASIQQALFRFLAVFRRITTTSHVL